MANFSDHSLGESLCTDCPESVCRPRRPGVAVRTGPDTIVFLCANHRADRLRRKARAWVDLVTVAASSGLLACGTVAAVGLWKVSPFMSERPGDVGWATVFTAGWSSVSAQASRTPLDALAVLATIAIALTVSMGLALAQRGQHDGERSEEVVDLEREALIARLTTLAGVHHLLSMIASVVALLVLAGAVRDGLVLPGFLAALLWGWLITDMIRVNQVVDVAVWQRLFLRAMQAESVAGIRGEAEKVERPEALRVGASGAVAMIVAAAIATAPRWDLVAIVGAVTAIFYCLMIVMLAETSHEYLREGRRGSLVMVALNSAIFVLGFAQFTLIPLLDPALAQSWLQPWRASAAVIIQAAVSVLTVLGALGHGAGGHLQWFKPLAWFTLRAAARRDGRSRSKERERRVARRQRT